MWCFKKVLINEDHKIGHLLIKSLALAINIAALVIASICWEFGSTWDLAVFHITLGPIPVHLGCLCALTLDNQISRELSISHDYLCGTVSLGTGLVLTLTGQPCSDVAFMASVSGSLLIIDIIVHCFTEDLKSDPDKEDEKFWTKGDINE